MTFLPDAAKAQVIAFFLLMVKINSWNDDILVFLFVFGNRNVENLQPNGKAYNIFFWKMKQKIDMLHALELHFPSLHFFKSIVCCQRTNVDKSIFGQN